MERKLSITDIISNMSNEERTLVEQAADLGKLIRERDQEKTKLGEPTMRLDELDLMIELQGKVVIKMLGGNDEECIPVSAKKPHLRIIK
jgi:hypothetical protein